MPFTLNDILHHFALVTNQNVCCPLCREARRIWKNGVYRRYRFAENVQEKIQRYRCRNADCRRMSFSVLPHPFLPRWRVSLCFLVTLWELWQSGCHTIAELARQANQHWVTMRRHIQRTRWLAAWLERERELALAGLRPCADPRHDWTPFCQVLSCARGPDPGEPKRLHTVR